MSSPKQIFIVDSFTDQPFRGNPAGVCLLSDSMDAGLMQSIASELNLSETAFVQQKAEAGHYTIRYFSPKMEIPLCGHATLAASKVLFDLNELNALQFTTVEQLELTAKSAGGQIEMQFPVYDLQDATAPAALLHALGISAIEYCGHNAETKILMLEIASPKELATLQPDFQALVASHDSINGVLVTAAADDEFDFHSRYFWPWSGTEEDPVTGGTHTFLAKYWGDKLNKTIMKSFQASKRTGQMEVELLPRNQLLIRGQATIVLSGALQI